jgi:hypothetical protein
VARTRTSRRRRVPSRCRICPGARRGRRAPRRRRTTAVAAAAVSGSSSEASRPPSWSPSWSCC